MLKTETRHYADACAQQFLSVAEAWGVQPNITTQQQALVPMPTQGESQLEDDRGNQQKTPPVQISTIYSCTLFTNLPGADDYSLLSAHSAQPEQHNGTGQSTLSSQAAPSDGSPVTQDTQQFKHYTAPHIPVSIWTFEVFQQQQCQERVSVPRPSSSGGRRPESLKVRRLKVPTLKLALCLSTYLMQTLYSQDSPETVCVLVDSSTTAQVRALCPALQPLLMEALSHKLHSRPFENK
ncbi:unnamed protein product [Menidia menidia]|uniref:(Atlantic silverside) hypothetical protein n=1 Tax=Menidia menidia TaxID=238744 RepID=A0A8S4BZG7_9TELE|nr:unnamed protein product [Menidia menidia]